MHVRDSRNEIILDCQREIGELKAEIAKLRAALDILINLYARAALANEQDK
jgi:hypothetical protein